MRISTVRIDGFGIFSDQSISRLSPGLNLFLGNNEAGKSTLLSFVRAILFGFPRNSSPDFHAPLAGGRHGGVLGLESASQRIYLVERRPGRSSGEVIVTDPDGQESSEELLFQLLGGITNDAFRNIYAFSLSELQDINSLQSDGVRSAIYGATAGAAVLALPKAERRLREGMEALFKPSGSKPEINAKLGELDDLLGRLREATSGVEEFDAHTSRLQTVEAQITGNRNELNRLSRDKEVLKRHALLLPDFHQLQENRTALAGLEELVLSFPRNGLSRLEGELQRLAGFEERLQETQASVLRLEEKISRLAPDLAILGAAEAIGRLKERRHDFVLGKNRLPAEERQLALTKDALQSRLESLGPDWTVDRVLAVDRSVFTREKIRCLQDEMMQAEKELDSSNELLAAGEQRLQDAEAAEQAASAKLSAAGTPVSTGQEALLMKLEQGKTEFSSALRDLPRRQAELENERTLLKSALGNIDQQWTEKEALEFDISLSARSDVVRYNGILRSLESSLKETKVAVTTRQEALAQSSAGRTQLEARLSQLPAVGYVSLEELDETRRLCRELAEALRIRHELRTETVHLQERLSDKQAAAGKTEGSSGVPQHRYLAGIGLIGALTAAVLVAMGKTETALVAFTLSLLVCAVMLVLDETLKRRTASADAGYRARLEAEFSELESRLTQTRVSLNRNAEEVQHLTSRMGLNHDVSPKTLAEFMTKLEVERDILVRRDNLTSTKQEVEKEIERLRKALEDALSEAEVKEQELRKAQEDWSGRLRSMGLRTFIEPPLIDSIFSKVEAIRQRIEGIQSLERRVAKIAEITVTYRNLLQKVAAVPEETANEELEALAGVFLAEAAGKKKEQLVANEALEHQRRNLSAARKTVDEARKRMEAATARASAGHSHWGAFLADQNLPRELSPGTSLEILNLVEECVRKIGDVNRLHSEVQALKDGLDRYSTEFRNLEAQLGRHPVAMESIPAAVEQLADDLEIQQKQHHSRIDLEQQLTEARRGLQDLEAKILRTREAIQEVLTEAGSSSIEDFRRKDQLFSNRQRLIQSIEAGETQLRRFRGDLTSDQLEEALAALRPEEVPGKIRQFEDREKELSGQTDRLVEEKAELSERIRVLSSSGLVAELRLEEERLKADIRNAGLKWARLAMAQHLIRTAKQIFEQEQQPRVVREAERFFSRITGEKYTRLLAPIGQTTIEVFAQDQTRKRPEELSRGTAEQLYLAIRFGYICSRAENAETLPVIMDDILVNFDPERAGRTAEAILDLAKVHQVIYFTCHPETVRQFSEISPDPVPFWLVDEGRIELQNP